MNYLIYTALGLSGGWNVPGQRNVAAQRLASWLVTRTQVERDYVYAGLPRHGIGPVFLSAVKNRVNDPEGFYPVGDERPIARSSTGTVLVVAGAAVLLAVALK